MSELNDEKLKMMEDEMNRFEEEIGLPNLPLPPSPPMPPRVHPQPIIGANTFRQVQAQLQKIESAPESGTSIIPPPPPPPPPMFVPPQVQRMGPPVNLSMHGSGPPPMHFGPSGGYPMHGPMGFGPPTGPMPPMGPGGPRQLLGPGGPIGPPGPMGPGGPIGSPGPMGPGGPIGPMSHYDHMGPRGPLGPQIPIGPGGRIGHSGPMGPGGHMGPGGPVIGPGGPTGPMNPIRPPGPGPMIGPGPGFIPPPPEFVQAKVHSSQGPVVVSRAPKKYNAAGEEEPMKPVTVGPEYPAELAELSSEDKKSSKKQKAKEMAEKVKASAVVSIMHEPGVPQLQPNQKKKEKKNKKVIRTAGGQTWEDTSLMEWEEDDFRLFCGDLGNDVTDEVLTRAFSKYSSFLKAKVVRDKRTNKTKGFGFVSFKDPQDFIRATKEMNGRYVGSRPIKLRKSSWKNRNLDVVRKKDKEKTALIGLLTGRS